MTWQSNTDAGRQRHPAPNKSRHMRVPVKIHPHPRNDKIAYKINVKKRWILLWISSGGTCFLPHEGLLQSRNYPISGGISSPLRYGGRQRINCISAVKWQARAWIGKNGSRKSKPMCVQKILFFFKFCAHDQNWNPSLLVTLYLLDSINTNHQNPPTHRYHGLTTVSSTLVVVFSRYTLATTSKSRRSYSNHDRSD